MSAQRYGDADDADVEATAGDLAGDGRGTGKGAVATGGEQDPHPPLHQLVDHLPDVLRAPGGAQKRTAPLVDVLHGRSLKGSRQSRFVHAFHIGGAGRNRIGSGRRIIRRHFSQFVQAALFDT